ncbi:hypothetical protein [Dactylosporangium sp. NPDC000521]|uniref:hypothetical protein n=1 Tax=Dactylosporangium sp. NPDC000521 TaxID=3363975 RepID=UPI0036A274AF
MEQSHSMQATFRNPVNDVDVSIAVSTAAEVLVVVDRARRLYDTQGASLLPGVSLWRTADDPEDSLCLVVAPDAWAIVHTDNDYFQTVTRRQSHLNGQCRRAYFDDVLDIPTACFIPTALAVETVANWMETGDLLPAAGFSNDLFS